MLEDAALDSVVLKIMQSWVGRLIRIQKQTKEFLLFRRGHYLVGKTTWKEAEKRQNIDPTQSAPEKVKEFLLCKLFRTRSQAYLRNLASYRAELTRIAAINKDHLLEAETNKVAGLPIALQVEEMTQLKPVLHYYLSQEEVNSLIAQSVSRQADWTGIMKAMMPSVARVPPAFRLRKPLLGLKSDSAEKLMRTLEQVKLSYGPAK